MYIPDSMPLVKLTLKFAVFSLVVMSLSNSQVALISLALLELLSTGAVTELLNAVELLEVLVLLTVMDIGPQVVTVLPFKMS